MAPPGLPSRRKSHRRFVSFRMGWSTTATAGDQARVTVLVAVDPETAFEVFTEEIDQWWRRGLTCPGES